MTPEKYSDRIHRAAMRLLRANGHTGKIVGDLEFLHTTQEVIDVMADANPAPPIKQLRALVADLRAEAHKQPADGLFSEGIVVTKIQLALRIEEILRT